MVRLVHATNQTIYVMKGLWMCKSIFILLIYDYDNESNM